MLSYANHVLSQAVYLTHRNEIISVSVSESKCFFQYFETSLKSSFKVSVDHRRPEVPLFGPKEEDGDQGPY